MGEGGGGGRDKGKIDVWRGLLSEMTGACRPGHKIHSPHDLKLTCLSPESQPCPHGTDAETETKVWYKERGKRQKHRLRTKRGGRDKNVGLGQGRERETETWV